MDPGGFMMCPASQDAFTNDTPPFNRFTNDIPTLNDFGYSPEDNKEHLQY
jgi:hypothetical protein